MRKTIGAVSAAVVSDHKRPPLANARNVSDGSAEPESNVQSANRQRLFKLAVSTRDAGVVADSLVKTFKLDRKTSAQFAVALLAESDESVREALLLAVQSRQCSLVVGTLDELERRGVAADDGCASSALFPPHVTPLVLACIVNDHATVGALLRRGHVISVPHRAACGCDECAEGRQGGELVESRVRRIDSYRAVSSSAHLCLATHDPILCAFELARDLDKCAQEELHFKEQYERLSGQVRQFARRFAQQCRTHAEVAEMMEQTDGVPRTAVAASAPRLRLALDCQMRQVLAETNVQTYLERKWLGTWADWATTAPLSDWLLRVPVHTLLYPLTALLFVFSAGRFPRSFGNPFARFLSYCTSYIVFLVSLLYVTQWSDEPQQRGFPQRVAKLSVLIYAWSYVAGMVLWDFCTFARLGFRRYFDVWWHWFDFILWGLFVVAFCVWLRAGVVAAVDGQHALHRRNWPAGDPTLVFESFFSAACVVAFWRIFYFLQLLRFVGPTVTSVALCIKNVCHYLVIMVIVILSFTVGINFLYEPYRGNTAAASDGATDAQPDHLVYFSSTLRFLYWAFYGYLPPGDMRVVVGDAGRHGARHMVQHIYTRVWGESTIAVYHVVIIIVLLNLMVSLMVNTADRVIQNEDVEWKFVRSAIWSEFFADANAVPPPFNALHLLVSSVVQLFSGAAHFSWPEIVYVDVKPADRSSYERLVVNLYARYLHARRRSSAVNDDDGDEASRFAIELDGHGAL